MNQRTTSLPAAEAIIHVPRDGATEKRLSRSLSFLVDDITEHFTDMLKYAPLDAQYFRLSITVNATGDPVTNESSTSTKWPGHLSPTNRSVPESLESRFEWWTTRHEQLHDLQSEKTTAATPSRTPPLTGIQRQRLEEELGVGRSKAGGEYHEFVPKQVIGKPAWADNNCNECNMPRSAFQHQRAVDG